MYAHILIQMETYDVLLTYSFVDEYTEEQSLNNTARSCQSQNLNPDGLAIVLLTPVP